MSPADRFARLPGLLAADSDLRRRGSWLNADCRIDIGVEPFYLTLREGVLTDFARGPRLLRSVAFSISGTEQAWQHHWRSMPEPGWHDIFALTKRGVTSIQGDLRPLLQNLQYFKDLLALPRRLPEAN